MHSKSACSAVVFHLAELDFDGIHSKSACSVIVFHLNELDFEMYIYIWQN